MSFKTILAAVVAVIVTVVIIAMRLYSTSGSVAANHELLSGVFERHVHDGLVDYEAIASDKEFARYLQWLAKTDPAAIEDNRERMAFWVNAYNALAINGVIANWPLDKVISVDGFFDKQTHSITGGDYTLNHIEKEIIFERFEEPRLHFVLVCAAESCPKLPSVAYTGANMEEQMQSVAEDFLNDSGKNRLDAEDRIFYLSRIFDWYSSDFGGEDDAILEFISPYLDDEKRKFIGEHAVEIDFLDYDWSLNNYESSEQ